jgi:LAO/AO transport system kinase
MTQRRQLTTDQYIQGVLAGERATLGRAITLIESGAPQHAAQAQQVLNELLPHSGRSIRVGITGAPGAGKSTLIEALGVQLCERGQRVAVLAIDPSSSLTRGSIMGDKTRMEQLARHPNAFIRPSPTGGALGGVARKTRESMVLCEAAGFDTVLIETVGVGQSEVAVRSMTDCVVLLALAGAGDELQAIKKGIVELADLIVITKADGPNRERAQAARADYLRALRYLSPGSAEWQARVLACSAQTGEGLDALWEAVVAFWHAAEGSGALAARRRTQAASWFTALIEEELHRRFYTDPAVTARLPELTRQVLDQQILPAAAAERLLEAFDATSHQRPS